MRNGKGVFFFIFCFLSLGVCGCAYNSLPESEELTDYTEEESHLSIDDGDNNSFEIENDEFRNIVNAVVQIPEDACSRGADWIEKNVCLRVGLDRMNPKENEHIHLCDYIFIKDSSIIWFKVDYPTIDTPINTNRHTHSAANFDVVFEDVTFDGNKDVLIFLGYAGNQGISRYCAYIYENGEYIYTNSFERIPNYSINNTDKYIVGSYFDRNIKHEIKYSYADGEFVPYEEDVNEYKQEK